MATISLNKSIEAHKLHPNTMTPLPGPDVTVPYGALLNKIERDRDMARFRYLGEPYWCPYDLLKSAVDPGALEGSEPVAAPAAAVGKPEAAKAAVTEPKLRWQQLDSGGPALMRAKVPGGWLIAAGSGVTFYPDPTHSWDGSSIA